MKKTFIVLVTIFLTFNAIAQDLLVESETFTEKGGWTVDQQFMDQMGSSYLLAHGMGIPVENASTDVEFPELGTYHVYVRTYNWTSPWYKGAGPGQFELIVNGKTIKHILGNQGDMWRWQSVGTIKINKLNSKLELKDLTGFDGRCDAIYFSKRNNLPPDDLSSLDKFRRAKSNISFTDKKYDLVVCGGGIAGMCAALSAARNGLNVALINDRPVLGGNNSSEVRVHLGGRIDLKPYDNLGNLIKEFGHTKKGNAQPASNYCDNKKLSIIENEPNIDLYLNNHIYKVAKEGDIIKSVTSKNIDTNNEITFYSPLFVDCTGDGTIGALAGADFRMGREARSEFNESRAPEKADKMTMGTSVQWYSKEINKTSKFPKFNYGITFNEESAQFCKRGDWQWETGMHFNTVKDAEYIRDYGLMVIYSNWSFLKNESQHKSEYKRSKLDWVAYIAGKRESRRLLGDIILNQNDLVDYVEYPDGTASTSWTIDVHAPDTDNTKYFPGNEFKSEAHHTPIYPYPVPYRCLYSRNVNNLFMAGRDISVTHVALGTVRVQRTTGMLGEVVGMAASICKKHNVLPRRVYQAYLPELKELMKEGAGKQGLENTQTFTLGGTLKNKPSTAHRACGRLDKNIKVNIGK